VLSIYHRIFFLFKNIFYSEILSASFMADIDVNIDVLPNNFP